MSTPLRLFLITALAMTAFAANSMLTRLALAGGDIGPWSFTLVRLVAGAAMLVVLVGPRRTGARGSWGGAVALLAYGICFSYAYLTLATGTGALILFALVQITMLGVGRLRGERLARLQWAGAGLAMAGLVALLLPGIRAPEPLGALMMAVAGMAWGAYSLLGRGSVDPIGQTAGNFLRGAGLVLGLSMPVLVLAPEAWPGAPGLMLALVCGAVTSALGYAVWYTALRGLEATQAGLAQLTVPPLAALGGILTLGEPLTLRFALASAVILAGVALATLVRRR